MGDERWLPLLCGEGEAGCVEKFGVVLFGGQTLMSEVGNWSDDVLGQRLRNRPIHLRCNSSRTAKDLRRCP